MSYALFDIGGTNTRVAVSEDLKTFCDPIKFKTPDNFEEGIDAVVEAVKKLTDKDIRAVSGGIRGVLDAERTVMTYDPGKKLTKWEEEPLAQRLKKKLKTDIYLENDTALVGLGEAVYGAGKEYEIVAYHTISTGVGGVKIENGRIDIHASGFEPGHQILDIDQTILGEDIEPTLENLVSGSALEERTGQKPYEIDQTDAVWDQLALYLSYGLRNTILYWSPHIIVLGGSMIVGEPKILLENIVIHTHSLLDGDQVPPEIVIAKLGDTGGLYGAMEFLNTHI